MRLFADLSPVLETVSGVAVFFARGSWSFYLTGGIRGHCWKLFRNIHLFEVSL